MATFGLKLGTFTLNATNGITIQSFSEPLTSRVNPVNIPRMHGGNLDSSLFIEPKIITMNGIIKGTTKEGYRTSKDAFKTQIETGRQKLYYFDDRYIWIQKVDFPIDDHITGLHGNFSLALIAVDPFWYATAASESIFSTAATSYDFSLGVNTGTDLITNGVFTANTNGWTEVDSVLSSVAGGQSGNCLQIASSGDALGQAYQDITTIIGITYKLTLYFKKGTSATGKYYVGTTADFDAIYSSPELSNATWAIYYCNFVATETTTRISFQTDDPTTGETALFDTVTCYKQTIGVLGNAPTPPLITLTAGSNFTNPSFQNRSVTNMPSLTHTGVGQAWIVNCSLFTATMGGSNSLSLLSGEFWNLLGGANTIRFTQSAGISVTIRVDWTDRWW